jgi:hypothetical protein
LDELSGIFWRPWYKADNVKRVRPMLNIAEVLVKAALSNEAGDS